MVEPVSMSIAIASLVRSAPDWFRAIENSALNQGKDFAIGEGKKRFQNYLDERKHTQNIQLALKNAAERGLKQFTTLDERDHYRDVLQVLSEGNSEALRREAVRQMSLANEPDYRTLSEKYNLSQRITAFADKTTHSEVNATPYLRSFFDSLLIELYNDPLFRAQMSDLIRVRAAMSGQRSLDDILATIRQLYDMLDTSYTTEQFQQEIDAYLNFIERTHHNYSLKGIPLQQGDDSTPELNDIFVPLHIAMMGEEEKGAGQPGKETILTLLETHPYTVLLGGPGFGKSMTTRYLAWSHSRVHIAPALSVSAAPTVLSGEPVPLRIELRRFSEARKQHSHLSFLSYITDVFLKQQDITISLQMFINLLERRAMLVLFDGLDEVLPSERKQFAEDIEIFAQRYPGNRLLVTSRPVGYQAISLTNRLFQHVHALNFDDEQIRLFIENWYSRVLKRSSLIDEKQEMYLLYNSLMRNARLHELAANPLLLTVMTTLHHYRRLPDERVLIYGDCADLLLDTWAKLKYEGIRWRDMKMGKSDQMACLAHLGFILHTRAQESEPETEHRKRQQDTAVDVPTRFIQKEIKRFLVNQNLLTGAEQNAEAERFLEMVKLEAGLLVERGTDETGQGLYGFVHRIFQEYFAAIDVYNRYEEEGNTIIIRDFLKKMPTFLIGARWCYSC